MYFCAPYSSLNDAGRNPDNVATISETTNQERCGKNAIYSDLRCNSDMLMERLEKTTKDGARNSPARAELRVLVGLRVVGLRASARLA
jgi:hypothetical protein